MEDPQGPTQGEMQGQGAGLALPPQDIHDFWWRSKGRALGVKGVVIPEES